MFFLLSTEITRVSKTNKERKKGNTVPKKITKDDDDAEPDNDEQEYVVQNVVCQYWNLQESARTALTRSLEHVSNALLRCDRSVIMGANQENFMNLVAHLHGQQSLASSSFQNIPSRFTYMDSTWNDYDPTVATRMPWDSRVATKQYRDIASFSRFQLKSTSSSAVEKTLSAAYENDISIVEETLFNVKKTIESIGGQLTLLRNIHSDYCLLLHDTEADLTSTEDYTLNNEAISKHYQSLFQEFHNSTDVARIFGRKDHKVHKLNTEVFSIIPENTPPDCYLQMCKDKMVECISYPYEYCIQERFLYTALTNKKTFDGQSISQKMTELKMMVEEGCKQLVSYYKH